MENHKIFSHPETFSILGCDENRLVAFTQHIIEEHESLVASCGPGVFKNASETAVSRVEIEGRTFCVKEFKYRGPIYSLKGLFRATQALRAFRYGARLNGLGIPVPKPLILVRNLYLGLPSSEYLIMEMIPDGLELDRFLVRRLENGISASDKRLLARALGNYLGVIHLKGVFHSDLKSCNILAVSQTAPGSGPTFYLLDYDDVRFGRIRHKQRMKNLTQLFLSIPKAFGIKERLLFLRAYSDTSRLSSADRKSLTRRVTTSVQGRHILYVGFEGDIIEP
jgi:tRNA A-37 threonylcarbamoyl transferase component Bud32